MNRGAYWELKARNMLEKEGYLVCKSGGSLGVFDIIAVNEQHTRLIQVKGGKKPWCSPAERLEIAKVKVHHNASKEIWYLKKRQPVKIVVMETI